MEEEHCANNWDLHAVVRFGCRRALSPPPRHDPSFLPPRETVPAEKQVVDAGWCFPDLGAGFGQDADELLKAFCAATSPPQLPASLPPPPPPPPTQQQQSQLLQETRQAPMMAPAEVPLQPAAPTPKAQSSGRQNSGGVPRSKRR